MRVLRPLLIVAALLYGVYGVASIALHRSLIYPMSDQAFTDTRFERVAVPVPDGSVIDVFVYQNDIRAPVALYFMGNVGALELFRPMLNHHISKGRSVVAMTYRGGGGMAGQATEARLKSDALAVFDSLPDLVDSAAVFLHGYSLGTGLAVHVAAHRETQTVVLSAPFDKMCDLMTAASFLPACLLPVDRWVTSQDAANVIEPVLILHGSADTLIPLKHGAALAAIFETQGTPVRFVEIPGAGHTNLMRFPFYLSTLDAFLDG